MPKLVSIIIPAFNVAPFLADCIESVLSQSHPRIEVLVYEDGSTDRTPKILKHYESNPKVKIFWGQANLGVAHARNVLLNHAQGRYIALQDADDISLPDRISHSVRFLDDFNFQLVSTNITTSDNKTLVAQPNICNVVIRQFQHGKGVPGASSCFRREIVDAGIRYDEGLVAGEDVLFDAHIQQKFPLSIVGMASYHKKPLYWYRKRGESLTGLRKRIAHYVPDDLVKTRNAEITAIITKILLERRERFLRHFEVYPDTFLPTIKKLYEQGKIV